MQNQQTKWIAAAATEKITTYTHARCMYGLEYGEKREIE